MTENTQVIDVTELPKTITGYLTAHRLRDADTAVGAFADDAVVTDDGQTYEGTAAIRTWLNEGAAEYSYTIELTGAERIDDDRYVAVNHLEGDFPGGVADLYFRFTLSGGRIARLVIEAEG